MQLIETIRGAGVKDWEPISLNAVNYADNAEFKLYYSNNSKFTVSAIPLSTTGLAFSPKVYSKLGKTNWTTEYVSQNSSILPDNTQSLVFFTANQTLNTNTDIDLNNADLISYVQEAPTVGTTTTLRFYIGTGLANYYQVVLPVLSANKKTKYNFQLKNGIFGVADTTFSNYDLGVATVTTLGVIPAGNIKRIDTIASAPLTPIFLSTYNSFLQQTGQVISLDACCFDEFGVEINDENEDIFCKGQNSGKTFKSREIAGTMVIQKTSPLFFAFGLGNTLKSISKKVSGYLANFGEDSTVIVNSSNRIINIGANLQIASVSVGDCNSKSPAAQNLQGNLDVNTYFYDKTTGNIEFSNSINEGNLMVKIYENKLVNDISMKFKYPQIECSLQVQRKNSLTSNTMLLDLNKVTLFAAKMGVEDDGDTFEIEWSAKEGNISFF